VETSLKQTGVFRTTFCLLLAFGLSESRNVLAQDAQAADTGIYNPIADNGVIVRFGHCRFTVLTPQLIRMEWSPLDQFEDDPSLVFLNRKLPVPGFHKSVRTGALTLTTTSLKLQYSPEKGTLGEFTQSNLAITLTVDGHSIVWHPGDLNSGNLKGTTRTLDGVRGDRTVLEPGLVSRDGWALVDDTKRLLFDSDNFSFTDGEQSAWPWVEERPAGQRQDWYFFGYGHDYRRALGDFVRIAGRIPLPPRFAFGAWWSRYWAYSDQELEQLVRDFRENDVPLDVLVIDMDWHPTFRKGEDQNTLDQSGRSKGWTGYTWNHLLFPDPEALLKNLHREGIKTTLNLHPASGVQPWEAAYPAMAHAMGIDPASEKYVPFDITNKRFALNYMNLLHHPLEKQGVDFWWLDWQDKDKTAISGVNPTFWLNYVHFTDQEREGKRPLLFHRWGGLGNHRYEIGFSGDTISVWESLSYQPYFTATAANVGYAYWSHDIGGHTPGVVEPELYLRWLQFGALSPILRTHTTKNPDAERRIWAYPEPYSDAMKDVYHLRYALIPYIYTEARRTYDTGIAFVHPLYYDYPESAEAYTSQAEYAFGDSLIAAPITAHSDADSSLAKESVWIPQGEWVEWPTGRHLAGPATVDHSFEIDEIPLYAKAGAIIPMAPKMPYTESSSVDPLIVQILPGVSKAGSTYTLYEDAGVDREYRNDAAAYTRIAASEADGIATIEISAAQGDFKGRLKQRAYELRMLGDWPPSSVSVDGGVLGQREEVGRPGWYYEGNTLTTVIPISSRSTDSAVTIKVARSMDLVRRRVELDGFAGKIHRLRAAYDTLRANFPLDGPSDDLIDALQTGDRLSYHPGSASVELKRFSTLLAAVAGASAAQGSGLSPAQAERYRAVMKSRWDTDEMRGKVKAYNEHVKRAALLLQDANAPSQ
jgi:alpha-glucosidase (family GH31 glycosyl hydrolase)